MQAGPSRSTSPCRDHPGVSFPARWKNEATSSSSYSRSCGISHTFWNGIRTRGTRSHRRASVGRCDRAKVPWQARFPILLLTMSWRVVCSSPRLSTAETQNPTSRLPMSHIYRVLDCIGLTIYRRGMAILARCTSIIGGVVYAVEQKRS
jgi:hypothetical protein